MATVGRGITNKQASYLAALCRELGAPYSGSGMSRLEASLAIRELEERVRARTRARAVQAGASQSSQATS
jgi:hypothetical protein